MQFYPLHKLKKIGQMYHFFIPANQNRIKTKCSVGNCSYPIFVPNTIKIAGRASGYFFRINLYSKPNQCFFHSTFPLLFLFYVNLCYFRASLPGHREKIRCVGTCPRKTAGYPFVNVYKRLQILINGYIAENKCFIPKNKNRSYKRNKCSTYTHTLQTRLKKNMRKLKLSSRL